MNKKKLILIVDDEIGIHESLRMYLTREGYEVYSVFRGDDVMEAFERMRPDLVILDIMMPGRTGTQVCADIRATSMTPIIMLTAKGEEVDKLLGFALGADDYIVKPFSPREIVSRIQVIFRRMNQMQAAPDQGAADDRQHGDRPEMLRGASRRRERAAFAQGGGNTAPDGVASAAGFHP